MAGIRYLALVFVSRQRYLSEQKARSFVLIPLEPQYKVGSISAHEGNDVMELISLIHVINNIVNNQEEFKYIEDIFRTHD